MTDRFRALSGVIPPIMTPLSPDGLVDVVSLDSLVRHLVDGGVDGIFALGSSGESAYLDDEQRRIVVDRILGQVAGQIPVLVGALDMTPSRVLDQARRLIDDRVTATVVTAPFYANLADREIVEHFIAIAVQLDAPVLAYNIPGNVHRSLAPDLLEELMSTDTIIGVKDSSGDLASLRTLTSRLGDTRTQTVLTGSEALLDVSLTVGADGAVAGLSNVDPVAFVQLVRAHRAGDTTTVARWQRRINALLPLYAAVEPDGGVNATQLGAMKSALHQRGIIAHPTLSTPMRQVSVRHREHVADVLAVADRV